MYHRLLYGVCATATLLAARLAVAELAIARFSTSTALGPATETRVSHSPPQSQPASPDANTAAAAPPVSGADSHAPAPRAPWFLDFSPAPFDEPIVTDRPDFTESTSVVPRGRFQLESGYTFVFDHERGRRSHENVFPEFLLRSGIVKNWELRVGWEGFSLTEDVFTERNGAGRPRAFHEHADGGTDMIVGFKAGVLKQQGLVPDFSVIGALSLPTGTSTKSAGNVDPELKLLWGYELSERFSLAGNVNFAAPTEGNRRFFQTAASLSLGMSLTDWLGAYAEYYGFYPNERNTDAAHYFNGGFTFPIAENFQLDLRAGMGLNEEADDFLAGAGVAFRF